MPPACPTIGAVLIVKDESHIIHECLNSISPFISTWVIVDTGSTDGTQQIITNLMAQQGLEGHLYQRPWKNFAYNRTEALTLAKPHMDYAWMIDADDYVEGTINWPAFFAKVGSPSGIYITLKHGAIVHKRCQIFKTSDNWYFDGVIHEFPECKTPGAKVELDPSIWVMARCAGARSLDPQKYQKDTDVLLNEVCKYQPFKGKPEDNLRDPKHPRHWIYCRYLFYLAQSYRDAHTVAGKKGRNNNAIKWYTRRAELAGFWEERYISYYQLSKLDDDNAKTWVWKASEIDPQRIEAYYWYVAEQERLQKFTMETYAMINLAVSLPCPETKLFLEKELYTWRARYLASSYAYHLGLLTHARTHLQALDTVNLEAGQRSQVTRLEQMIASRLYKVQIPHWIYYPNLDLDQHDHSRYSAPDVETKLNELKLDLINTNGWIKKSWDPTKLVKTAIPGFGLYRRPVTGSVVIPKIRHFILDEPVLEGWTIKSHPTLEALLDDLKVVGGVYLGVKLVKKIDDSFLVHDVFRVFNPDLTLHPQVIGCRPGTTDLESGFVYPTEYLKKISS